MEINDQLKPSNKDEDKKAEEWAQEILMKENEPEMDEDGYAVGDPYAEAAKLRKKIILEDS